MSAVQHICNSFMWNILGKTKIIEKIWQSLITHESKKFPVSLGSELINVATQISMWPCKKILQINKRSPTFIRQTRVLLLLLLLLSTQKKKKIKHTFEGHKSLCKNVSVFFLCHKYEHHHTVLLIWLFLFCCTTLGPVLNCNWSIHTIYTPCYCPRSTLC